jgi:hypothetical protein
VTAYAIQSPCLWWQDGVGYIRHRGMTLELLEAPPVRSLHQAPAIHWEPRRQQARCIVAGERRALTADECAALMRWVTGVSTAAIDARDGATSLVVVVG